jgi:hypothetical protein
MAFGKTELLDYMRSHELVVVAWPPLDLRAKSTGKKETTTKPGLRSVSLPATSAEMSRVTCRSMSGCALVESLFRYRYRTAPSGGRHSYYPTKHSAQMRLVAQPARERKLGERLPRCPHHRACKLDAPQGDVVKGSNTDADLERSK